MKRIIRIICMATLIICIAGCLCLSGCGQKEGNCALCGGYKQLLKYTKDGNVLWICDDCYELLKWSAQVRDELIGDTDSSSYSNSSNYEKPEEEKIESKPTGLPTENECKNFIVERYQDAENISILDVQFTSDQSAEFRSRFTYKYPVYSIIFEAIGNAYWDSTSNVWEYDSWADNDAGIVNAVYDLSSINGTWQGKLTHAFNETVQTNNNETLLLNINGAGDMKYEGYNFLDSTVYIEHNINDVAGQNAGSALKNFSCGEGNLVLAGELKKGINYDKATFKIAVPMTCLIDYTGEKTVPDSWEAHIVVGNDYLAFDFDNMFFTDQYLTKIS